MVPGSKIPAVQKITKLHGKALSGKTCNGFCSIVRNCAALKLIVINKACEMKKMKVHIFTFCGPLCAIVQPKNLPAIDLVH